MNSLRTTAHHEAGHAIACLASGGELTSVTIEASSGHLGMASTRVHVVGTRMQGHRWDVIESLAGPIAERMHSGRWSWPHAHGDLVQVCRVFFHHEDEHYPGHREQAIRDLITESAAIVAKHWRSIERVARALLRHGTLTGDQVEALYREHERGRAPLTWRSLVSLDWAVWLTATPDQVRVRTSDERAELAAANWRAMGMPEREIAKYLRAVAGSQART